MITFLVIYLLIGLACGSLVFYGNAVVKLPYRNPIPKKEALKIALFTVPIWPVFVVFVIWFMLEIRKLEGKDK